jgi:hypothetical protein
MNQEINFKNSEFHSKLSTMWRHSDVVADTVSAAIDYTYWLLPQRSIDNCDDSSVIYPESSMTPWDEFPDGLPPQEAFDFISKYIKSNGRYVKTN